jgi:HME family heavy-metal exporter
VRTTAISLVAIPLSLLAAVLVFRLLGLSINTMTLGGLAIAIGELVDDAVVDVENVLRRLQENRRAARPRPALQVVARACSEVRSGVVLATATVVLVFVPLFALPGMEGRLFVPLGLAYIVAILASLAVAVTVTPVLCVLLLPKMPRLMHGDGWLVARLKAGQARLLGWALPRSGRVLVAALALVLAAAASVPLFPRSFLPPFNEGTLTVNVILQPGIALAESERVGQLAETLLRGVPEVLQVGRRTGRAELDEHAEGVHSSELDVDLRPDGRPRAQVIADIRTRLAGLPASVSVGQPIAHRLDHLLSGVRAQIAVKVSGDDLDEIRGLADSLRARFAAVPGIADLQVEKQVRIPQLRVVLDYPALAAHGHRAGPGAGRGAAPGGRRAGGRGGGWRAALRPGDPPARRRARPPAPRHAAGGDAAGQRAAGQLARIEVGEGPNQIARDRGRRRIVVSANAAGSLSEVVREMRAVVAATPLPAGVTVDIEGQFQAQEEAQTRIAGLAALSLALVFLVLYGRYRSLRLVGMVMVGIPAALVGAVAALALAGQPCRWRRWWASSPSPASPPATASSRSATTCTCTAEGEAFGDALVLRGARERLTPVLMTALTAALALVPLLFAAEAPGKEILHPVAVVIFGGLVSSTLLDVLLTPLLFRRYGGPALASIDSDSSQGDTP